MAIWRETFDDRLTKMAKILDQLNRWGVGIGGACLLGMIGLVVANVIFRRLGLAIVSTYDLVQFLMVVIVAFALPYTALKKSHIIIRLVVSRFPQRIQAIATIFSSVIWIITLVVMVAAMAVLIHERWTTGILWHAQTLPLPYLPFRFALALGLLLFSLVVLRDLLEALRQAAK